MINCHVVVWFWHPLKPVAMNANMPRSNMIFNFDSFVWLAFIHASFAYDFAEISVHRKLSGILDSGIPYR